MFFMSIFMKVLEKSFKFHFFPTDKSLIYFIKCIDILASKALALICAQSS